MSIKNVIPAVAATEGAGVRIFRGIGNQHLRHLDPFLLLDHFDNDNAQDYLAGFPSHPHRGFVTFTYMLDGQMEHQDSMGHKGVIGPGDAQWMKAAHGVIHSEMPKQIAGRMRGFQLWINLPASEKLSAPDYQELAADAFPVIDIDGGSIKLLIGDYQSVKAPISDTLTQVNYLDINLEPDSNFTMPITVGHGGFVFCYDGALHTGEQPIPSRHIALIEGDDINLMAGSQGARFIVVTGQPIGEPVVQHGPFVMNSREEIMQAMQDYQQGTLTQMAVA